jgi:hypothetical protein
VAAWRADMVFFRGDAAIIGEAGGAVESGILGKGREKSRQQVEHGCPKS